MVGVNHVNVFFLAFFCKCFTLVHEIQVLHSQEECRLKLEQTIINFIVLISVQGMCCGLGRGRGLFLGQCHEDPSPLPRFNMNLGLGGRKWKGHNSQL